MDSPQQPITGEIVPTYTAELLPDTVTPADRNPALIYLASLGEGSRRTMLNALGVIACLLTGKEPAETVKLVRDELAVTLPWGMLRAQHVAAVRSALAGRYHFKTANKILTALRQVLDHARVMARQAAQEAQERSATYEETVKISVTAQNLQDALADAIRAAKKITGEDATTQAERGRGVSSGEFMALMDGCARDASPAGVRDAAILALFRVGGLRRAEMAGLALEDYDREAQRLTVRGKRNKTRMLPLEDPGARAALTDWIYLRGQEPGALFTRIDRVAGGTYNITTAQLSDQAIYYILDRRRTQASVEPFTPHDLRRSFAGDLLDAGVDLVTVQKLMGHSNPQTTAGYDRRGEQTKRRAVQNLHVPYRQRYTINQEE